MKMVLILILIIVALLGTIFFMNMRYRKMQEIHLKKLEDLHLDILQLTRSQKNNQEKIQLAEEFKHKFNRSRLVLIDKIISLQHEFLEIISKNNLIR